MVWPLPLLALALVVDVVNNLNPAASFSSEFEGCIARGEFKGCAARGVGLPSS